MIEMVRMSGSTYAPPPHRFEAGTPPIAQAVGLAAAARYLGELGMDQVAAHEQEITAYALAGLQSLPGVRILGPVEPVDRGGAVSFVLREPDGTVLHPHDVTQLLDSRGIAVRGGHHCARPLHERFGIQSSTRASFYLYTTPGEIDALVDGLDYALQFFGGVR
jgi:cysteine desulfurase/selenocysteine lyase